MNKKVIITGATGLIGKNIFNSLVKRGDSVIVFGRSPDRARSILPNAAEYVEWNYKKSSPKNIAQYLENADAVIHLAGENVMSQRWNELHKHNILESRIAGTKSLIDAAALCNNKPKVFISASAVGYYGSSETPVNEESKSGKDFLADVTRQWEEQVMQAKQLDMREVRIRIGIVLDKNEGALAKMLLPFKLFIGGPLGNGRQPFPWIHIDDVTGLFIHALDNNSISGPLNAVAPEQISMNEFTKVLGNTMRRPSIFKVPEFVLNIVLGEAAGVVTKGSFVVPQKAIESNYHFIYPQLRSALNELLK